MDRADTAAPGGFRHTQGGGGPRGGGLGSGLIYDPSGLILTNAHVVRGAERVTVKLADNREFKNARVLGTDDRTDIAVVKIDAQNLPALKFGDSSRVRVGDWAIAVGNPFGLEQTLTVGVISAKAREVPLSADGPGDYLQTDASINPGNSGGPLLDIYGRVIGVNNAIFSRTGGNVGIGFAIPSNTAREIAQILAREGRVRRARLGVGVSNVEDRAAAFGLAPGTRGVLIETVDPSGPAARAGLQPGDVVTRFNDTPVSRSIDFQRIVSRAPVGTDARLTVLRGGRTLTITARLEELRDTGSANDGGGTRRRGAPSAPQSPQAESTALGIGIAPLTPDLVRRYGVAAETRGVVVARVEENSPAERAGLREGDVIERVGQTAVTSPRELQEAVRAILGRQNGGGGGNNAGEERNVALYVNRRGDRRFVIVSAR
jgi:serine protease Do